jgi:hypothetical protein
MIDIDAVAPKPWRMAPQVGRDSRAIVDANSVPLFDKRRTEAEKAAIREHIVECANAQMEEEELW